MPDKPTPVSTIPYSPVIIDEPPEYVGNPTIEIIPPWDGEYPSTTYSVMVVDIIYDIDGEHPTVIYAEHFATLAEAGQTAHFLKGNQYPDAEYTQLTERYIQYLDASNQLTREIIVVNRGGITQ